MSQNTGCPMKITQMATNFALSDIFQAVFGKQKIDFLTFLFIVYSYPGAVLRGSSGIFKKTLVLKNTTFDFQESG